MYLLLVLLLLLLLLLVLFLYSTMLCDTLRAQVNSVKGAKRLEKSVRFPKPRRGIMKNLSAFAFSRSFSWQELHPVVTSNVHHKDSAWRHFTGPVMKLSDRPYLLPLFFLLLFLQHLAETTFNLCAILGLDVNPQLHSCSRESSTQESSVTR